MQVTVWGCSFFRNSLTQNYISLLSLVVVAASRRMNRGLTSIFGIFPLSAFGFQLV